MRRDELAHVLRAAATIVDGGDILVIGSQSILGSFSEDEFPDQAIASIEVDVAFFNDPDAAKADLVDAVIGEMSPFHEQFGIYGQGVEVTTAQLPPGWRGRLVEFERADTGGAHAKCLDPYDLLVAKLTAGREKDLEFTGALVNAGLIEVSVLVERARRLGDGAAPAGLAQRVLAAAMGYRKSLATEPDPADLRREFYEPSAVDRESGRTLS